MRTEPIHFLLIEDDDCHAKLVTIALEDNRLPTTYYRVADGAEALAYLRRQNAYSHEVSPDVILLDLKLPKVDGHEVLKAIKEDETLRMIPVVILTTSDADLDRQKAYYHHANSYLTKPLEFDKFHQMIHDLQFYWGQCNVPVRA